MGGKTSLLELLATRLPPELRSAASLLPDLEESLQGLWDEAHRAWPQVSVPAERFFPYLGERLRPGRPLAEELERVRAGDLFLACGCAAGDAAALDAFEREYLGGIDGAVLRLCHSGEILDEVKGRLRHRLLWDQPPRIGEYSGRGDLVRWLRVVAVRQTLNLVRQRPKEIPVPDDDLLATPAAGSDPELSYLRRRYADEFKEILQEGLTALSAEERRLLRHRYLDGMQGIEIATLYRIHPSTVSRRLDRARARLLTHTRKCLRERLGLGGREMESLLGLVRSRLDLSIRRLLEPEDG